MVNRSKLKDSNCKDAEKVLTSEFPRQGALDILQACKGAGTAGVKGKLAHSLASFRFSCKTWIPSNTRRSQRKTHESLAPVTKAQAKMSLVTTTAGNIGDKACGVAWKNPSIPWQGLRAIRKSLNERDDLHRTESMNVKNRDTTLRLIDGVDFNDEKTFKAMATRTCGPAFLAYLKALESLASEAEVHQRSKDRELFEGWMKTASAA